MLRMECGQLRSETTVEFTYSIGLHTLPEVFELLQGGVRCQDVDNAKVIDGVHALVRLVGRPQPAFVLVENEVLSLARVRIRELEGDVIHRLQVGYSHDTSYGCRIWGLRAFHRLASRNRNLGLTRVTTSVGP